MQGWNHDGWSNCFLIEKQTQEATIIHATKKAKIRGKPHHLSNGLSKLGIGLWYFKAIRYTFDG